MSDQTPEPDTSLMSSQGAPPVRYVYSGAGRVAQEGMQIPLPLHPSSCLQG